MLPRLALIVSAISLIWAAWLTFAGGVNFQIAGHNVTSNEPMRPILLAVIALFGYVAASGVRRVRDEWGARLERAGDARIAAVIALSVFAAGIAYADASAVNADNYGYVSQAELWLRRTLTIPQPWMSEPPWPDAQWTFAPLGYRPAQIAGGWGLVPVYSPGLPMLMAAAKLVGGQELLYWVVPASGALLVWMTLGIGRRLGSSRAGLIAAWLVATSPAFLLMLMHPMTDVPIAAAWATVWYFALGTGGREAALAGLAASVAILIRPNLAPLAGVLGLWFMIRAQASNGQSPTWRHRLTCVVSYASGVMPGLLMTAVIYQRWYGTPFSSGYGDVGTIFDLQRVVVNARNYFGWYLESQGPLAIIGILALVLPVRQVWPWVVDRRFFIVIWAFLGFVILQFLAYLVFDGWWFLRFFLVCWPFLMLGTAAAAVGLLRQARPALSLVVAVVIVVSGVSSIRQSAKRNIFITWRDARLSVDAARAVAEATPVGSVIYTLNHSGSLRFYGGRMTLRPDLLAPEWLDRSVEWFRTRGAQAYLMIEAGFVPQFKREHVGQTVAEDLDKRLVLNYGDLFHLYDLSSTPQAAPRKMMPADLHALRSREPVSDAFEPRLGQLRSP